MSDQQLMFEVHELFLRASMSIGAGLGQDRGEERDFSICTPEDFVNKFGGNLAINKVFYFQNKKKKT